MKRHQPRYRSTGTVLFALLLLPLLGSPPDALGQQWENRLQTGDRVQIDLGTQKATVTNPWGQTTQLWDGVHRLQDGSTITVHNGVVVPNRPILDQRQPPVRSQLQPAEPAPSPCLVLQRKTCGMQNECAKREPCGLATQLLRFEQEERMERITGAPFLPLQTLQQCNQALSDEEMFTPCLLPMAPSASTP